MYIDFNMGLSHMQLACLLHYVVAYFCDL